MTIGWHFNDAVHKRVIGNGLLTLIVRPVNLHTPDGRWKVQINGVEPLLEPEIFTEVAEAMTYAEQRVKLYCKSMMSEVETEDQS